MSQQPMMEVLRQVEKLLPMLLDDREVWKGVDITYHPPRVERVWRQWGTYRINLHRIHPCERREVYLHPHPWPSAMRVRSGSYEMVRGYGAGTANPIILGTTILTAGSSYSMDQRDEWHSVRPLESVALSLMVSGPPWNRKMPIESPTAPNPLAPKAEADIMAFFAEHYVS